MRRDPAKLGRWYFCQAVEGAENGTCLPAENGTLDTSTQSYSGNSSLKTTTFVYEMSNDNSYSMLEEGKGE
jgi:hypothetical protein